MGMALGRVQIRTDRGTNDGWSRRILFFIIEGLPTLEWAQTQVIVCL